MCVENGNGQLESGTVSYNANFRRDANTKSYISRGCVVVGRAQQVRIQLYSALGRGVSLLVLRWQARVIHIGAELALVWESGAVSPVCCWDDDWEVGAPLASTHQILHEAP